MSSTVRASRTRPTSRSPRRSSADRRETLNRRQARALKYATQGRAARGVRIDSIAQA